MCVCVSCLAQQTNQTQTQKKKKTLVSPTLLWVRGREGKLDYIGRRGKINKQSYPVSSLRNYSEGKRKVGGGGVGGGRMEVNELVYNTLFITESSGLDKI